MPDAVANLRKTAVKDLIWTHNMITVIGEDMARDSISGIIDYYARSRDARYTNYIIVAEGTASEMLQTPAQIQKDLEVELDGNDTKCGQAVKSACINYKGLYGEPLKKVHRECYRKAPMLQIITKYLFYLMVGQSEDVREGNELPSAYLSGSAVFKNEKLVGWMDDTETRGYLWINGEMKIGVIMLEHENTRMSLASLRTKSGVEMKVDGSSITANIKVDTEGLAYWPDREIRRQVHQSAGAAEALFEKEIEKEMRAAVSKAQVNTGRIFSALAQSSTKAGRRNGKSSKTTGLHISHC